ncbi:MAG: NAD(P)(+) transhydrogenase (Re/Si-specific) subunit beta [Dehalococcoidia bacterium]|jgi:NAD(P) transhydrogenase subunit beta|nr:NAD(P)(+) transhydrogenase (Re/Si-specific) subunit beta [Dehalococcoidia bacterium]
MDILVDLAIIVMLLCGVRLFRRPPGARKGNLLAAGALGLAFLLVLYRYDILDPAIVILALLIGSAIGWATAMRVNMIQIPAMIAFQHGAGGIAAFLVSFEELVRVHGQTALVGQISGAVGLIIGAFTFGGSMIASAKLAARINQRPTVLKRHSPILVFFALAGVILAIGALQAGAPQRAGLLIALIAFAIATGVLFAIRIGGADMPVLISFLNATAGLAAAFCGIIIQNRLLIACGATVAASGSILTHVMCKAMNRGLVNIFVGTKVSPVAAAPRSQDEGQGEPQAAAGGGREPVEPTAPRPDPLTSAAEALRAAASVVIIPGYGMALAQAQFNTVRLAGLLAQQGRRVRFAIHPVAGRMPGHMNVLLAEADVDYSNLVEMDDVNPEMKDTDVALVIGACDVVNPAAIEKEGTPISGMPILAAHEARTVIVCNLDERPGYSGVQNPLYSLKRTILLFGDAKKTLDDLTGLLK